MPEPPQIAINGTYIQEQASGLGVVNQNLISGLLNLKHEFDFTVYSHADSLQAKYPEEVVSVTKAISPDRGFSGHMRRFLWYNTALKQASQKSSYCPVLFSCS